MPSKISHSDLLPGETLIMSKFSNMVISINEVGLSRFAFDEYMGLIGMHGKEALGGKIHLTNFRIIFKTHFLNRVRGTYSIYLPNIVSVKSTFNMLTIETKNQTVEFVLLFKDGLVNALTRERANIGQPYLAVIKNAVLTKPEAISLGFKKLVNTNLVNEILTGNTNHLLVFRDLTSLEKNSYLELKDLFL